MFTNLLWLFFAHFVGDYPLQADFLAQWKSKSYYVLLVHCFIWATAVYIACCFLGIAAPWKWWFLFVGHALMDNWKCRGYYKKWNISDINSFYIDQTWHAIQVLIVSF